MPKATERFEQAAREVGLSIEILRFDEGTKTAADAARAVGCQTGQIVKSLVFVADGEAFVALTSGANQADTQRLAELLGAAQVRRATPDEARDATGFSIGGTPPFGHPRRLRVLVDTDLLTYDELWAAAGTPNAVFSIHPSDLLAVTSGQPREFKQLR